MNKVIKDAVILTVITLIAGFLLAFAYEVTKEPIERSQEQAKQEAYATVVESADSFEAVEVLPETEKLLAENGYENNTIDEAAMAIDGSGEVIGYVVVITSHQGYGGDIRFAVGIDEDGAIGGLQILSIAETAGLGMKATEESFLQQYEHKNVDTFVYTQNGAQAEDEIDSITSATVTTNAVTDGVNAGLCFYRNYLEGGRGNE